MSAKHLMGRGFNRFAYIGAEASRASDLKYQGLLDLTGQPPDQVPRILIPATLQDAQGWQTMQASVGAFVRKLKPPVGILASDDLIGRYLVDVCLNANLRVPDDVAVVGTGNDLLICDALEPTLTSIDAGYERIGHIEVDHDVVAQRHLHRAVDEQFGREPSRRIAFREFTVHDHDVFALRYAIYTDVPRPGPGMRNLDAAVEL